MKLSSLTQQDKIKLAAELDGKKELKQIGVNLYEVPKNFYPATKVPNYATSYDAIIPLIQKQWKNDKLTTRFSHELSRLLNQWPVWPNSCETLCATPSQLLDALLVSTGKAEL